MSTFHQSFSVYVEKGGAQTTRITRLFQADQMQNGTKTGFEHVLTNTQPLSYHFSHLGVNAFVATCQTPTCFEFYHKSLGTAAS